MAPAEGEPQSDGSRESVDPTNWKRRRESFSCTAEAWEAGKAAWRAERTRYPAWTDWLEAALDEKARSVREALGVTAEHPLPPAPDRLPTGRRAPRPLNEAGEVTKVERGRRSFTCTPAIWDDARAAWWAAEEQYPSWTDWVEEAITEKARRTGTPAED